MKSKIKRELYEKPEIESEDAEIGVYGKYGGSPEGLPLPHMPEPFFGLCSPC